MKKHKKLFIILPIVAVVLAAVVVGLILLRNQFLKAPVYQVQQLDSGGFDYSSFYGTVYKSDNINFYLDADKKVEEVFVKEGDSVKKGDSLFKYDTTIMEYDIKEKELDVRMAQLALNKAENLLEDIRNTPVTTIPPTEEPTTAAPETEAPHVTDASGQPVTAAPTQPAPEPEEPPATEPQEESTGRTFFSEAEKKQAINEQQVAVNMAQADLDAANIKLESMKKALGSATVTSTADGTVFSVQDPEKIENDKPFCTIRGAANMTVKSYLTEFDLGTTSVGDMLAVTDFMTGASSLAEIIKINDYPTENASAMVISNPNTSYYAMTAVIQDPDQFDVNATVSIQKLVEEETPSIVIPKGFVRTGKDGSSYVLKDKDGKLVKQEVAAAPSTTPGTLSVTEGIGPEDYIAFPYGDRSKEGTLTTVVEDPWAENNGLKSLFGG
ncbi:MAG: biotin/lipoyl-binding protein [Ruminococcus sp.]